MVNLTVTGDSMIFEFTNSQHYLTGNGTIEVPKGSLSLVVDDSDMATFKKAGSNDIFVSATYDELGKSKSELVNWFKENAMADYFDEEEVQDMIDDSLEPVIESAFTNAAYDSENKTINFSNSAGTIKSTIDATDFIKDGMVNSVSVGIVSGVKCLIISFNTDSGKEDINIPLSDIFPEDEYYNKTDVDNLLIVKADATAVTEVSNALSTLEDEVEDNELVIARAFVEVNDDIVSINQSLENKADASSVYTKAEADEKFVEKPDTTHIIAVYNVTDTSSATKLLDRTNSFSGTMEVDGVDVELATGYTFSTTGEHTVKFNLNGTSIEGSTFNTCVNLISITIPDYVTSIGNNAFYWCDYLTSITCYATTAPTVSPLSLDGLGNSGKLYYPSGSDYSEWLENLGNGWTVVEMYYLEDRVTTLETEMDTKQDALVSGTNIKTINNNSILGSGDIEIEGGNNVIELTQAEYDALTTKDPEAFYIISDAQSIDVDDIALKSEVAVKADTTALTEVNNALTAHTADSTVHITAAERTSWNAKLDASALNSYSSATQVNSALANKADTTAVTDVNNSLTAHTADSTVHITAAERTTWNAKLDASALDSYSSATQVNSALANKADASSVYTKTEADEKFVEKPDTTHIIAVYNVTDTSSATKLYNKKYFSGTMEVDGVEIALSTGYTFSTTGEHTVKFSPNGTSIGNNEFRDCDSLTLITIPDSVTSIGSGAFQACISLTSVTIPDSVTSIGDWALDECFSLTSVTIPDSVTSIGSNVFYYCRSLTSVTIGSGVTSIGNGAFQYCSGLTSITCNAATAPTIGSATFQSVKTNGTLTVQSGSSGYDVWMGTGDYYLGKYNWTKVEVASLEDRVNEIDNALTAHTADSTVHITAAERTAWNAKLDSSALDSYSSATEVNSALANKADASRVTALESAIGDAKIVIITQAAYDALETKDANTLYIING